MPLSKWQKTIELQGKHARIMPSRTLNLGNPGLWEQSWISSPLLDDLLHRVANRLADGPRVRAAAISEDLPRAEAQWPLYLVPVEDGLEVVADALLLQVPNLDEDVAGWASALISTDALAQRGRCAPA